MDVFEFITVAGLSSLISTGAVIYIFKKWFEFRLTNSIKHEYDNKLEKLKFEFKKLENAQVVADLFSQWINGLTEERRKLNKASFLASLWLPDALASEVNKRLKNKDDAKEIKDLIIECRNLIHDKITNLKPEDVTFFPPKPD